MKLVNSKRAAAVINVNLQRFYELVRTGILPPGVVVRLGRQVRIDEDALHEWIAAGGQPLSGGWRRDFAPPNDSESVVGRSVRGRR